MFRLAAVRFTWAMSPSPAVLLATVAALSAAVVGGVFYAFSTFVMRGLSRGGAAAAVTAMRGINAEAQSNGAFLTVFLGSAAVAATVGVMAVVHLRQPGSGWILAGAVLATVPLVVTVAVNVPLNDHLAALDVTTLPVDDFSRVWMDYLRTWTLWNHVRSVAPLLGSMLMVVGLRLR